MSRGAQRGGPTIGRLVQSTTTALSRSQRNLCRGSATRFKLHLRRERLERRAVAKVRVEDIRVVTGGLENSGESPNAERRREESVFASGRVVWPDR